MHARFSRGRYVSNRALYMFFRCHPEKENVKTNPVIWIVSVRNAKIQISEELARMAMNAQFKTAFDC